MIDLNSASVKELCQVIHIGVRRASQVIGMRPFKDVHELSNVPGMGVKRMADVLDQGLVYVKRKK